MRIKQLPQILPAIIILFYGCSTSSSSNLEADLLEKSFKDDLSWISEYGKSEYIIKDLQADSKDLPKIETWQRFKHPSLPISFAYPKGSSLQIKEIDLEPGDFMIDIVVKNKPADTITIVFQKNLTIPSHINDQEKKALFFNGISGTYYKARNIEGGKSNLEKFIAKVPNSRYGIHITGKGDVFRTLITTLSTTASTT